MWTAIDLLKVERIDHGVQSTKDAALMARLAQDHIPLTVCPLSNLKLCVFPQLADHNIGQLLDAGLVATINSDDPAYFGGYMNDNFLQTFEATGLTAGHAYQLAKNSFEASFVSADMHPVVLGAGTRFFPEVESPIRLRQTATKRFASGVVYVGYERVKDLM